MTLGGDCGSPQVNVPSSDAANQTSTSDGSSDSKGGQENKPADHLSSGTIAGISTGVAVAAALIAARALVWRMKKGRHKRSAANQSGAMNGTTPSEKSIHCRSRGPQSGNVMPSEVQEMGTQQEPRGLAAKQVPLELTN